MSRTAGEVAQDVADALLDVRLTWFHDIQHSEESGIELIYKDGEVWELRPILRVCADKERR